jgi:hypothetical protein
MLKDGALELMKNESSEDGNAATAGSLEESWAKQDEEAFVASLAESDIKAIRLLWGAGASIVGAAQKAVDMRLVDLGHQYVEENRTKCRDPAGVFSLAGKWLIRKEFGREKWERLTVCDLTI